MRKFFLLSAFAISAALTAQQPCGLSSLVHTGEVTYSPIAHIAHVTGTVILMVRFDTQGKVMVSRAISGPPLLTGAAVEFTRNLVADTSTGTRECPIVIRYELEGRTDREYGSADCPTDSYAESVKARQTDVQHFVVTAKNVCITVTRDPHPTRIHHKHLLFF